MKILFIHLLMHPGIEKIASGTEAMSKDVKLQIKYLQATLGQWSVSGCH